MTAWGDDAAWVAPPVSGAVFMSEEAVAGTSAAEVELTGSSSSAYWHFYSDEPFFIFTGETGLPALDEAAVSTPAAPNAATPFPVPAGSEFPIKISANTRVFRWKSTVANQRLYYRIASPGGA